MVAFSFYEHDLSDQDKQKIMQNFEQCLFSGLDQDQYQILWVQHQDKINQDTEQTRLELNFCDTECRTFYRKNGYSHSMHQWT